MKIKFMASVALLASCIRAQPPPVVQRLPGTWAIDSKTVWQPLPALEHRAFHAMAYDPSRQRLVIFGGQTGLGASISTLDDTWEWDGETWVVRAPVHRPPARMRHGMAFDPVRGTVLLAAGNDSAGNGLCDVWEWDGRDWKQLADAAFCGPPVVMATDPVRNRVAAFTGGCMAEWDGRNWTWPPQTCLPFRAGAAMAYDAVDQRIVVFGGENGFGVLKGEKTWLWNGTTWTGAQPPTSPADRSYAAMATDPTTGRPMLHGGYLDSPYTTYDDTWLWEGTTWRQVASTPGLNRSVHAMASDNKRVALFSGADGSSSGGTKQDTWGWDGTAWTQLEDAPLPLSRPSAGYDPARDQVLLLDFVAPGKAFVLRENVYTQIANWSGGGLRLAYHEPSQAMFSGSDRDAWLWDGQTWTFHSSLPTYVPSLLLEDWAYDSVRQKMMYLSLYTSAFWEWDSQGWTRRPFTNGPTYRTLYAFAFDPTRNRAILYGGTGYNETWEWDGAQWKKMQPAHPPPAFSRIAIQEFVPALGGVLVAGWLPFSQVAEAWLWRGTDWERLPEFDPPWWSPNNVPYVVYDVGRQRLLAFFYRDTGSIAIPLAWEARLGTLTSNRRYPRLGESVRFTAHLPQLSGRPFALLLSEGTRPAIPMRVIPNVGVEVLPLSPGQLLLASAQAGLFGVLDPSGNINFTLTIPHDPALWWQSVFAAGLAFDNGLLAKITEGVHIEVVR